LQSRTPTETQSFMYVFLLTAFFSFPWIEKYPFCEHLLQHSIYWSFYALQTAGTYGSYDIIDRHWSTGDLKDQKNNAGYTGLLPHNHRHCFISYTSVGLHLHAEVLVLLQSAVKPCHSTANVR
jgi:hypothetical protein